ncbi:MAG TPA: hypothetical protein VIZ18_02310, partial [Ktedonobacteraceae bacterium]
MKCPDCGTEDNTPDVIYCGVCGRQLRQSNPDRQSMLDPQAFVPTVLSGAATEVVDLDSLYQEGLQLLARDDIEQALVCFQEILDREPRFEGGKLALRVKQLREKLNLRKKSLFRKAEQAHNEGNWDQAIAAIEAVLALDVKDRRASVWLRSARKNKRFAP